MIQKNMTMREIVKENPNSVDVFNDLKLDYCCGGHKTLETLADQKNLDAESIVAMLNRLEKPEKGTDDFVKEASGMNVRELIRHIERVHHDKERALIKDIDKLLNTILVVHYEHHKQQLIGLHSAFSDLKKELEQHFAKEEKEVFPMILDALETNTALGELEEEHEAAGALIEEIQRLTDNFSTPPDTCVTYERTIQSLKSLVEDVFIHIYKENSILFRKVRGEEDEKAS